MPELIAHQSLSKALGNSSRNNKPTEDQESITSTVQRRKDKRFKTVSR